MNGTSHEQYNSVDLAVVDSKQRFSENGMHRSNVLFDNSLIGPNGMRCRVLKSRRADLREVYRVEVCRCIDGLNLR